MMSARDVAVEVIGRLRAAGHEALLAGGCVRDELLGLVPKDYDVATDAPPERVRELFPNSQAVGAAFGVMLVRLRRQQVEVATFRADMAYVDGRRPSGVRFTNAREDARRRDFTINGLFADPLAGQGGTTDHSGRDPSETGTSANPPASRDGSADGSSGVAAGGPAFAGVGRVIDYVGGQDDLRNGVLRAIGNADERFAEDHLRLLRAVRFAARFGLTIEPATADAILRHAPQIRRIAPERVADELRRMLTAPTRVMAWTLLRRFRLVEEIFRFLPAAEVRAGDLFTHFAAPGELSFGLALAAATLEDRWERGSDLRLLLGKASAAETVRALRAALKISNEESDEVEGVLSWAEPMLAADYPRVAVLKRFLASPVAGSTRQLLDAVARAGVFVERVARLSADWATLSQGEVAPPPLISGDDLTAQGMKPGPVFKRILDETYDAQLEGRVTTRDEAMALARKVEQGAAD